MKYLLAILCLLTFAIFEEGFAQEKDINQVIEKHARTFLKNRNINSVSIGVVKDGQTFTGHLGEIEKGQNNPPTDQTIYEIASVTKTMTGYLVAKATMEGRIHLNDDIRQYLTGNYPNLEYKSTPITIQHLLTHTSGLPAFLPLEMNQLFDNLEKDIPTKYLEIEESYSKSRFMEDLRKVAIKTEPGTNYSYSNTGAELAGYILENVYQKDIDQLLKEAFSEKHQMSSLSIKENEAQRSNTAPGYWMDNNVKSPQQLNVLWGTAGGAKVNMIDMMRYARLQLSADEDPIVKTSQDILYQQGKTLKVSYFWRVWTDKYGTSYNHHGGTTGTQNWLFIFPDQQLAVSIITNQSGPKTPGYLRKTAMKIVKDVLK